MSALAVPKDSLILVTGANGFIGSHVADQFLQRGYRVRGTARSAAKLQSLSALFEKNYGAGRFEAITVADMRQEGAFDEAVKGVSGIAHVASVVSFDPDPNKVIPETLAGQRGILRSAAAEPSVKRFVYTSSSQAAVDPVPNREFSIDSSTWNEKAIKNAWAPPPYEDERKWDVYGASKTQAEQELWRFVKEEKPGFVVNSILPNANFGPLLNKDDQSHSTHEWLKVLYTGENLEPIRGIPPQYYVDVIDTALLHVAAIINPSVANERLFAFAGPWNFNDILRILRRLRPNKTFVASFGDDNVRDLSKVANERAEELLRELGQPGFASLEAAVKSEIDDFETA